MLPARELHRIGGGSGDRRRPEWLIGIAGRDCAAVVRQGQRGAERVRQIELGAGGRLPNDRLVDVERAQIAGVRGPGFGEEIGAIVLIGGCYPVDRLADPAIEGIVLKTRGEGGPGDPDEPVPGIPEIGRGAGCVAGAG
ncbi:MAG: hypothetical protein OEY28_01260 [Nitrospira sp.]|nr:hypothetical protein [Nitrospira sp.]